MIVATSCKQSWVCSRIMYDLNSNLFVDAGILSEDNINSKINTSSTNIVLGLNFESDSDSIVYSADNELLAKLIKGKLKNVCDREFQLSPVKKIEKGNTYSFLNKVNCSFVIVNAINNRALIYGIGSFARSIYKSADEYIQRQIQQTEKAQELANKS